MTTRGTPLVLVICASLSISAYAQVTNFVLTESVHDQPLIVTGRLDSDGGDTCPPDEKECAETQSRKLTVKSPKVWMGKFNAEVQRNKRVRILSVQQPGREGLRRNEDVLLFLYVNKPPYYWAPTAHAAFTTIGKPEDPYLVWNSEVAKLLPCGTQSLVKPVPPGTPGATWPGGQGIRVATLVEFVRKHQFAQGEFRCIPNEGNSEWGLDIPAGMREQDRLLTATCQVDFVLGRDGQTSEVVQTQYTGDEKLREMCRIKVEQMRMPPEIDANGLALRKKYRANFDFDRHGFTWLWFGERRPTARLYHANHREQSIYVDENGIVGDLKSVDRRTVTHVAFPQMITIRPRGLSQGAIYAPPMDMAKTPVIGEKADLVIVHSNPRCRSVADVGVVAYVDGTDMTEPRNIPERPCTPKEPPVKPVIKPTVSPPAQ